MYNPPPLSLPLEISLIFSTRSFHLFPLASSCCSFCYASRRGSELQTELTYSSISLFKFDIYVFIYIYIYACVCYQHFITQFLYIIIMLIHNTTTREEKKTEMHSVFAKYSQLTSIQILPVSEPLHFLVYSRDLSLFDSVHYHQ
jgi:hypothetical protein